MALSVTDLLPCSYYKKFYLHFKKYISLLQILLVHKELKQNFIKGPTVVIIIVRFDHTLTLNVSKYVD